MSYSKQVWSHAVREAARFWSAHKIVTTIPAPLITALLWTWFKGWKGWGEIMLGALISVLSFFALWGIAFIVSLILAPKQLDAEKNRIHAEEILTRDEQISAQQGRIEQLERQPALSQHEQEHLQMAEEKLSRLTPEGRRVLHHVLHHGKTYEHQLPLLGLSDATVTFAMQIAIDTRLLIAEREKGSLAWEINPEFRVALKKLLSGQ